MVPIDPWIDRLNASLKESNGEPVSTKSREDPQLIHTNCRFQRSGSPQKGSISDPDMLQAFAAFAVLRRSAYPVVEL
jgi:hypothetical protein